MWWEVIRVLWEAQKFTKNSGISLKSKPAFTSPWGESDSLYTCFSHLFLWKASNEQREERTWEWDSWFWSREDLLRVLARCVRWRWGSSFSQRRSLKAAEWREKGSGQSERRLVLPASERSEFILTCWCLWRPCADSWGGKYSATAAERSFNIQILLFQLVKDSRCISLGFTCYISGWFSS